MLDSVLPFKRFLLLFLCDTRFGVLCLDLGASPDQSRGFGVNTRLWRENIKANSIMEGGQSEASATLLPSAGPGRDSPYQPPLLEGHIVRLLELAPGARDDAVVMRLFPTELEHAPDFEALSYVWGDPGVTVPVTCSGLSFGVTVNLHTALVRTRYTDRVRTLWADAICIYSH